MAENFFVSLPMYTMSRIANVLLIVAFLTSATGVGSSKGQTTKPGTTEDPAKAAPVGSEKKKETEKKGRGKFTISKETTHVTGPVDEDGYIDYAAALNELLKHGVTPENNANVLIWQALGPHRKPWPDPSPDFFKEMGIQAPPEKGNYFIDEDHFRRERLNIEVDSDGFREFYGRLDRIRERPWKAEGPSRPGIVAASE